MPQRPSRKNVGKSTTAPIDPKGTEALLNAKGLIYEEDWPMFEDGTNVAVGTRFREEFGRRVLPWYIPADGKAPRNWKDKWTTLRSRFDRIVDECCPQECVLVQRRIPAYAPCSPEYPMHLHECNGIWSGTGLSHEPARLFMPDWRPLTGLFPIRSVQGHPMLCKEGNPLAFRFGLWRHLFVQGGPGCSSDQRPLPVPRLTEMMRDGTSLLYQLPAEIAVSLWRNWPSGFSRKSNSGESLWLDALFELSWQQQCGGPLYSERHAWIENCFVQLRGCGLFPRLPFGLCSNPGTLIPHENGHPMAYCAKLSDVARASVAAIDEILERGTISVKTQTVSMQTTILFMAADPDGVTKLALGKECRAIREKIRASDFPKALDFKTEWAVRPDDLLQYLNEYRPHVVHFSGHGSTSEELILHNDADQAKPVSKEALRSLFTTLKDNIRLVVLNACYSRLQAEAIVEVIDCAVGMKKAIGDQAAIVFAASFYRALGFGRSVKEAFDQGRTALLLEGIPEENTPELLVKGGVTAAHVFLAGPAANPK